MTQSTLMHSRSKMVRLTTLTAALFLSLSASGQTIRYVAENGANSGTCTDPKNPCATVVYANGQANPGDTINIAEGEYTNPDDTVLEKDITLQGAGHDETILQSHAECGQAVNRVITIFHNGQSVIIKDLTIRHGVAMGNGEPGRGGGIYNPNGSGALTLTNVAFDCNRARVGGGLLNINGSNVLVEGTTFTDNEAIERGGAILNAAGTTISLVDVNLVDNIAGLSGGGIYNENPVDPYLDNVVFELNVAGGNCGGMCLLGTTQTTFIQNTLFTGNTAANGSEGGGGLFLRNSSPTITNVVFENNEALNANGGGMYLKEGSTPVLEDVAFIGNVADSLGGGMFNLESDPVLLGAEFTDNEALHGGGMWNVESSPPLQNASFIGNTAGGLGGGLVNFSNSSPILTNVLFSGNEATTAQGGAIANMFNAAAPFMINGTLSGNEAGSFGGGTYNFQSPSVLINTVTWGNTATSGGNEIYNGDNASVQGSYNLYADGIGDIIEGDGFVCNACVVDADPLFLNPANADLRLAENSPAIDAGYPNADPLDYPTDGNGNPVDLAGSARFFPDAESIDIGAYEWHPNVADETQPEEAAGVLTAPQPNPVRGSTSLTLQVAETQQVYVEVFDPLGRRVQTLYDGALATDTSETLTFDASALPAGVYILRAQGTTFSAVRRVTVIR